jgi:5'-nucleotidase
MLRVLLTNDDAYQAPGLLALRQALDGLAQVWVVAPDRENSATSHSLTLHRPLRLTRVEERVYHVDGTPVDCVMLGVHALKLRPQLVIAGINHGPNMGQDVVYSGTVAAAREGAMCGVPSLAVSVTSWTNCRFEAAANFTAALVRAWTGPGRPQRAFWNINVPNVAPHLVRGVQATYLGRRTYRDVVERRVDPRGRAYYWISGQVRWKNDRESDCGAVAARQISVTPLSLALTDAAALPAVHRAIKKIKVNVS